MGRSSLTLDTRRFNDGQPAVNATLRVRLNSAALPVLMGDAYENDNDIGILEGVSDETGLITVEGIPATADFDARADWNDGLYLGELIWDGAKSPYYSKTFTKLDANTDFLQEILKDDPEARVILPALGYLVGANEPRQLIDWQIWIDTSDPEAPVLKIKLPDGTLFELRGGGGGATQIASGTVAATASGYRATTWTIPTDLDGLYTFRGTIGDIPFSTTITGAQLTGLTVRDTGDAFNTDDVVYETVDVSFGAVQIGLAKLANNTLLMGDPNGVAGYTFEVWTLGGGSSTSRGGTTVVANPTTTSADPDLDSISIDGVGYNIPGDSRGPGATVSNDDLDITAPNSESTTVAPSQRATAHAAQQAVDAAETAAADDLEIHNNDPSAHPGIESTLSSLRSTDATLQNEITRLQGLTQEYSTQAQVVPSGVNTLADLLTTELSVVLGEVVEIGSNVRYLQAFLQDPTRTTSDTIGTENETKTDENNGARIPWDVRRPPSVITLPMIVQADLNAIGARGTDTFVNLAISTLDGAFQVVDNLSIEFAIGIGRAVPTVDDARIEGLIRHYSNFGVVTAGATQPLAGIPGYAYTGYNPEINVPAVGSVAGIQGRPLGGIYTVTSPPDTQFVPPVEAGKTYFAKSNAPGAPTDSPVAVVIDRVAYLLRGPFGQGNRFYEVLDFAGFTAEEKYGIQVLFDDGQPWIMPDVSGQVPDIPALPPFATLNISPKNIPGIDVPLNYTVSLDEKQHSRSVTNVELTVQGVSATRDSGTAANIGSADHGSVKFSISQDQADLIETNLTSSSEEMQAAIKISFNTGQPFTWNTSIAVNDASAIARGGGGGSRTNIMTEATRTLSTNQWREFNISQAIQRGRKYYAIVSDGNVTTRLLATPEFYGDDLLDVGNNAGSGFGNQNEDNVFGVSVGRIWSQNGPTTLHLGNVAGNDRQLLAHTDQNSRYVLRALYLLP